MITCKVIASDLLHAKVPAILHTLFIISANVSTVKTADNLSA